MAFPEWAVNKMETREWLQRKTSVQEIEEKRLQDEAALRQKMQRKKRLRKHVRDKGLVAAEKEIAARRARWNPIWGPFIASMAPGDELWEFCSPPETWATLMGRSGYAIVREGEIIRVLVLCMN